MRRATPILVVLAGFAGLAAAQPGGRSFPGLRPGQGRLPRTTGQERERTGRRAPGAQQAPESPLGLAPRTGTGLGYWEALTNMFRRENRGADPDLAASPTRVFMLRMADNVALRPPGMKGWERVYHWRKTRILETGYQVDTGNRGRVIQAFFDGAYLDCHRRCLLELMRLDRECARIRFHRLGRVKLEAADRPLHLDIPGGYTVRVRRAIVSLRLVDERRFFLANLGPEKIEIDHRGHKIELGWNECCQLPLLTGPAPRPVRPVAAPGERIYSLGDDLWRLAWGAGTDLDRRRGEYRLRAGTGGGRVKWGNCGIELKPGDKVVIRPFGGAPPDKVDERIRSPLDRIREKEKE